VSEANGREEERFLFHARFARGAETQRRETRGGRCIIALIPRAGVSEQKLTASGGREKSFPLSASAAQVSFRAGERKNLYFTPAALEAQRRREERQEEGDVLLL
jgi:hypothetical protein